jgi:SpoVK/Ycf46/Vps4 family AAA+-type ATPase
MKGYKENGGGSWLARRALTYWRNLAKNWKTSVGDCDFFDLFEVGKWGSPREAVARFLRHFTEKELLDAEVVWKSSSSGALEFNRGGLTNALQTLWNDEKSGKRARAMLEEWSRELEARAGTAKRCDGDKARVGEVWRALKLGEAERGLLEYALVRQRTVFDDFPLQGPSRQSGRVRTMFLAMAVDCPESEVEKALSPEGALRKHEVLDCDGDLARGPFRDYLEGVGPMALEGRFYKRRDTKDALPWSYFGALAKNHGTVLKRLLKAADGRGGANILLYGEPGTGKTSFALALARELGMTLYEILQGTRDGEKVEAQSRMTGIFLCNERAPKPGSMALVDEADELLRSRGGGFFGLFSGFGGGGGGTEKGAVNSLLDGTKIPTVWIVNAPPESIDGSVRRRFDYSVRFDKLTDAQRRAVWRNTVAKTGLAGRVGEEQIAEWSRKWRTSAGGIATVLGNVRRMRPKRGEEAALVAKLMRPHCELAVSERPGAGEEGVPRDYSLEGLNVGGDVPPERVVEAVRRFREALKEDDAGGDPDRPRMNLLLWGPPGTGKTEFVRHLGAAAGAPVCVRMGSDLLSMWVGGTEKNIREAFREAEEEGAILFLDEIDGLLQNRAGAQRSWEVTQVNELLHRMENFRGVMAGATNFMDNLDPAVLRRFTFKLRFGYLDQAGKRLFFERMFHARLTEEEAARLDGIRNLAPGDYRTVRQSLHWLGGAEGAGGNAALLDALAAEAALKRDGGKGRIGF